MFGTDERVLRGIIKKRVFNRPTHLSFFFNQIRDEVRTQRCGTAMFWLEQDKKIRNLYFFQFEKQPNSLVMFFYFHLLFYLL